MDIELVKTIGYFITGAGLAIIISGAGGVLPNGYKELCKNYKKKTEAGEETSEDEKAVNSTFVFNKIAFIFLLIGGFNFLLAYIIGG